MPFKGEPVTDWERDCMQWRGRILTGNKRHWCMDWDALPIDETTSEWPCSCAGLDDLDILVKETDESSSSMGSAELDKP